MNGDNANYYSLATSIQKDCTYRLCYALGENPHNVYSPGYPFIMAFFFQFVSNEIVFIKILNGIFFLGVLILTFFISKFLLNSYLMAFIVSLMLLFNQSLLRFSTIMMSEIPFLLFSLSSIWFFIRCDFSLSYKKNWRFFAAIFFSLVAYYTRAFGISLILAINAFLLFKKQWKYLVVSIFETLLLYLPWSLRNASLDGKGYLGMLVFKNPYREELGEMGLLDWFSRFWINAKRYITTEIPNGLLSVEPEYTEPNLNQWILGLLIIFFCTIGFLKLRKFSLLFLLYIGASFSIFLSWAPVWFGSRYLIAIIPLITLLFILGTYHFMSWILQQFFRSLPFTKIYFSIAIIMIILRGVTSIGKLSFQAKQDFPKNHKNYFNLAKWTKRNVPKNAIIACRKPELFYIFSDKKTTYYVYKNEEEVINDLTKKRVDYVVLDQLGYSSTGRYLYPAMQKYKHKFQEIAHIKDPDTFLFKFIPNN